MSLERTCKPTLKLVAEGKRCCVKVPSAFAEEVAMFLRRKGLQVSPPAPSSGGVENIEIGGKVDAPAVQALLDRWAA
jgi:hypothetical protein